MEQDFKVNSATRSKIHRPVRKRIGLLIATLVGAGAVTAQEAAPPQWGQAPSGVTYGAQPGSAPPPPGPYAPAMAPPPGYPAYGQTPPSFRPDSDLEASRTTQPSATTDAQQPTSGAGPGWTPPAPPDRYRRQGGITREEFMSQQAARRAEMDKRMQEAQAQHDQAWQQRGTASADAQARQDQLYKEMQEREAQLQKEMDQRKADLQKEMQAREDELRKRDEEYAAQRQQYAPSYGQPYPQAQAPTTTAPQGYAPPPAYAPPGPQWRPGYGPYPQPGGYAYAPPPGYGPPPAWGAAPYPQGMPAPAAGTPTTPGTGQ